ncbi:MAG: hypothetical protein FJ008_08625 [Chloroflexi bacterium]|nr:hypothetical protein [Chloroflexota bacterium]
MTWEVVIQERDKMIQLVGIHNNFTPFSRYLRKYRVTLTCPLTWKPRGGIALAKSLCRIRLGDSLREMQQKKGAPDMATYAIGPPLNLISSKPKNSKED